MTRRRSPPLMMAMTTVRRNRTWDWSKLHTYCAGGGLIKRRPPSEGKVATDLAILNTLRASDGLTIVPLPPTFKTPNGRDQMSFRANVLPCQWPPGLEFHKKHVWSTYVWRPVFFRQILR